MTAAMYKVIGDMALHHDGRAYEPGAEVELEGETAALLLERGIVEPTADSPEAAAARRGEVIAEAIRVLEIGRKKTSWTKTGEPQVKAIEAVVGFDIDAAERDAALEARKG